MPRMREWLRGIPFGLVMAAAMEGTVNVLTGRPVSLVRVVTWAMFWSWFSLHAAGRRLSGRCSIRFGRDGS